MKITRPTELNYFVLAAKEDKTLVLISKKLRDIEPDVTIVEICVGVQYVVVLKQPFDN